MGEAPRTGVALGPLAAVDRRGGMLGYIVPEAAGEASDHRNAHVWRTDHAFELC